MQNAFACNLTSEQPPGERQRMNIGASSPSKACVDSLKRLQEILGDIRKDCAPGLTEKEVAKVDKAFKEGLEEEPS